MNIITADFNWISFLIVAIGVVVGMVKSNTKKGGGKPPVFQEPVFTFDTDEEEEEDGDKDFVPATSRECEVMEEQQLCEEMPERTEETVVTPTVAPEIVNEQEEEVEEKPQFDIRQAVISSEILNRPHF